MKLQELFEAIVRKKGDTYTDEELAALEASRKTRLQKSKTRLVEQNAELIKLIKNNCLNNFKALMSGDAKPLFRSMHAKKIDVNEQFVFTKIDALTVPRRSKTENNLF